MEVFIRVESLELPDSQQFRNMVLETVTYALKKGIRIQPEVQGKHKDATFFVREIDVNDWS